MVQNSTVLVVRCALHLNCLRFVRVASERDGCAVGGTARARWERLGALPSLALTPPSSARPDFCASSH